MLNSAIKVTWPGYHGPTQQVGCWAQLATNYPNGGLSNLHSSYLPGAIDHIEPGDSLWLACVFLLLCLKTQSVTGSVCGGGELRSVWERWLTCRRTLLQASIGAFFNPDARDTCEGNLESLKSWWETENMLVFCVIKHGELDVGSRFFSLFIDTKLVKRTSHRPLYWGSV